eukprot:NODE_32_length_32166_cov_0.707737.p18 type:complete len:130 gc:universal NODE_32_length_32166_cov_0.707737:5725-5336(-)
MVLPVFRTPENVQDCYPKHRMSAFSRSLEEIRRAVSHALQRSFRLQVDMMEVNVTEIMDAYKFKAFKFDKQNVMVNKMQDTLIQELMNSGYNVEMFEVKELLFPNNTDDCCFIISYKIAMEDYVFPDYE